ncbi:MAG: AAA family ATPase [Alistipes sp.]|nr:AAA family ATPase [Alistipes sp.]
MKLFLIGYMGCGKSSLGRKLAKRAGYEFVDMDNIIEEREGATIPDIFAYEGEEYFRTLESNLIEELGRKEGNVIISAGGGAPTWRDNMERMTAVGYTFYLRRTPEQIASRLSPHGRQKRPKLRGLNDEELVQFMRVNMAEREPFYARASHIIECSEMSDEAIIEYILSKLQSDEQ